MKIKKNTDEEKWYKKTWVKASAAIVFLGGLLPVLTDGPDLIQNFFPKSDEMIIENFISKPEFSSCGVIGATDNRSDLDGKSLEEAKKIVGNELESFTTTGGYVDFIMGGEGSYTIRNIYIDNIRPIDSENTSFIDAGLGCGAAGYNKLYASFNLDQQTVEFTDYTSPSESKLTTFIPPIAISEGTNAQVALSFTSCSSSKIFDIIIEYIDNRSNKSHTYKISDISIYTPLPESKIYSFNGDLKNPKLYLNENFTSSQCSDS